MPFSFLQAAVASYREAIAKNERDYVKRNCEEGVTGETFHPVSLV